jgi:hypothetical protein
VTARGLRHLAFHTSWPNAIIAIALAKEVLEKR